MDAQTLMVIDTSAVMAVLLNEPERMALVEATVEAQLVAPPTLPWEVGNAFSALIKRRRVSAVAARRAWEAFERIPVRLITVSVPQSLELAERFGLYAYDAYVLAVARTQAAPVLTLDTRLAGAAQKAGLRTVDIDR